MRANKRSTSKNSFECSSSSDEEEQIFRNSPKSIPSTLMKGIPVIPTSRFFGPSYKFTEKSEYTVDLMRGKLLNSINNKLSLNLRAM